MTGAPPGAGPPRGQSPGAGRGREPGPARRPGRRRLVEREDVVDVVAEQGFHGITVCSVAERLGVRPSTLYRYFATRDELLAYAVDARFDRAGWPEDTAEWRGWLEAHAWALWEVYARHPGLAQAVTALPVTPPALTRRIDRITTRLLDLGFAPHDAVLAVDVIGELALDTFLFGRVAGERPEPAVQARRTRVAAAAPLLDPRLRRIIEEVVAAAPRAWFARKLELVLDGLATRPPAARGADDRREGDGPTRDGPRRDVLRRDGPRRDGHTTVAAP
ncbi:AcrR family transcriptional regulator [Thermocatellispora tengchongensis]|uniref:AcrR family transcriptional regulator n=1 Tax=Thermocatellispora tengchongensis TaxID=1073253 RepID=A0A840P2X3_9ACTN|nr:TetR/AcrR family transcriptional regulator [Thermocatellispora tengchongensis]MBB5133712.1 AcrR family transcriptional regulator [Thermocatellispora tengchongensis]